MEAWFSGYSPELICIVYVGFDVKKSLGYNMTGSHVAVPIWVDFMEEAFKILHPDVEDPKDMEPIKVDPSLITPVCVKTAEGN